MSPETSTPRLGHASASVPRRRAGRSRPGAARGLLATLTACALSAACAGEDAARRPEPDVPPEERYGGTAVVGGLAELTALNELVAPDHDSDQILAHVIGMTLVRYDEHLQPAPYLAERWDTVPLGDDRVALTFYLRRDVRWHDGVPTTAHDVKFTFDRARDPAYGYPNPAFFAEYDSAVVLDDHTIRFVFRRHADYMDVWRAFTPMPKHILGKLGPEEMRRHPFNTQAPVGNGPFRFVSHAPQDRWVFEANPDFPEALGGRPYLDRLVYRIIPEESTLLAELFSGGIDVDLQVLPEHADRIREAPHTQLLAFPTRQYVFVAWNGRRPIFRSPAVRRALALALDRQEMVDAVRHGYGLLANGPVPPFHWAHDPSVRLPYDPDSARAILEREGWVDRDGDGVRERDGVPLAFEIRTNPNRQREDLALLIRSDLAAIGARVRIRVTEWGALVEDVVRRREFDAVLLGLVTEFRIDDRDLFACDRRDGPTQFAYYCNPRVDTLLAAVARTTDRRKATPLWHELQRTLARDQPFTWLYYEVRPVGVRTRLRNVQMDIRGTWINARDWWIAPEERGPAPARSR